MSKLKLACTFTCRLRFLMEDFKKPQRLEKWNGLHTLNTKDFSSCPYGSKFQYVNSISTLSRSTLCDKVCKTFTKFNSHSRYFPHLQLNSSKGLTTHMRKLFLYSNFTCFYQLDSAFATYTSPVAWNCICFTFTTRKPRAGGKPSGGARRWPRHITPQHKFTFLVLKFQENCPLNALNDLALNVQHITKPDVMSTPQKPPKHPWLRNTLHRWHVSSNTLDLQSNWHHHIQPEIQTDKK